MFGRFHKGSDVLWEGEAPAEPRLAGRLALPTQRTCLALRRGRNPKSKIQNQESPPLRHYDFPADGREALPADGHPVTLACGVYDGSNETAAIARPSLDA